MREMMILTLLWSVVEEQILEVVVLVEVSVQYSKNTQLQVKVYIKSIQIYRIVCLKPIMISDEM